MTIQEINDAYNRIIVELDRKALKNAFDGLLGLIAGTNQYNFQDKLDELQETYKQMLHYRVKGVQDPMQDEIYERILASAYELADQVRLTILARQSSAEYFAQKRKFQNEKETLSFKDFYNVMKDALANAPKNIPNPAGISPRKQYSASRSLLFYRIWTSDLLTMEDELRIREIMDAPIFPASVASLVVSALQLSLEEQFDWRKIL